MNKVQGLLAAGAFAAMLASSVASAATTTNTFAFRDKLTFEPVYGTISGLVEGDNDASTLTASVLYAKDTTLLGTIAGNGGEITVTNGVITYADAVFSSGSAVMFAGSDVPQTFYPQVTNIVDGTFHQAYNDDESDVFKPAETITNAFSYIDEVTGQTVAGTLTGLLDGHNQGLGLVATITRAPYADLLGTFYGNSGDFTLTNGVITDADGYFNSSFGYLFLGAGSASNFYPEVHNYASGHDAYNETSAPYAVFSPFAAGVPEASTWSMMIAGFGAIGVALRSRRRRAGPAPRPVGA